MADESKSPRESSATVSGRIEALAKSDQHAEALKDLDSYLEQAWWSDSDRSILNDLRKSLLTAQSQRFESEAHAIRTDYAPEGVQTVPREQMTQLEERVKTLEAIDPTRPIDDIKERIKEIRKASQIEWEYNSIYEEVRSGLDQSARSSDANIGPAKQAVGKLRTEIMPEWESKHRKGDALAALLLPRLRDLLQQADKELTALANRNNILTTLAGTVQFRLIEEEYQRWINPPSDDQDLYVAPPTEMAEMGWIEITGEDGTISKLYKPIGTPLPLEQWHDDFLNEAVGFAKEKGGRDLKLARELLEASPLAARQAARSIIQDDPAKNTYAYFKLPKEIRDQVQEFLDSEELQTRIRSFERARALLDEAEELRVSTPLEALKRFQQALVGSFDLRAPAKVTRDLLFATIGQQLSQQMQRDHADQTFAPEQGKARLQETQNWLRELPDYDTSPDVARKIDPEEQLRPLRNRLQKHEQYCWAWSQLAELDKKKRSLSISELDEELEGITRQMKQSGLVPEEFPLHAGLTTYLKNERNAHQSVEAILRNTGIFSPDPADTDANQLLTELRQAQSSTQPQLVKLARTLNMRYLLYQEATDSSTLEVRKNRLNTVMDSADATEGDKSIARRRLVAVEKQGTDEREARLYIERAEAWADQETLEGFQKAWADLEAAMSEGKLVADVSAAMLRVRDQIRVAARQLPDQFGRSMTAEDISKVRLWLPFLQKVGVGDVEQHLKAQFNPMIWKWEARNSTDLWSRLQALCQLAESEPNSSERWLERAQRVGLEWLVRELDKLRGKYAQAPGRPHNNEELPEVVVARAPETLYAFLNNSFPYYSKAIEVNVWLGRLNEAYALMQAVPTAHDRGYHDLSVLEVQHLDLLIELAELRHRVVSWQQDKQWPEPDKVKQLRQRYERLLKPMYSDGQGASSGAWRE
jgi:hypothetical protein